MEEGRKAHLVFLPMPLMGHLTPMVELAKLILLKSGGRLSMTMLLMHPYISSSTSTSSSTLSDHIQAVVSSSPDLHVEFLEPPVEFDATGHEPMQAISMYVDSHKPRVRESIARLQAASSSAVVAALVVDFIVFDRFLDIARELDVDPYVYFTAGAGVLSLTLYLPVLDGVLDARSQVEGPAEIGLPGLGRPLPFHSLPGAMMQKDKTFDHFVGIARGLREAKGIIANTFFALEPSFIAALDQGLLLPDSSPSSRPKIYPVGPLLSTQQLLADERSKHECIRWLDQQPHGSVVLLCFGSGGAFSTIQVREIAAALERSGHRFLWSLRRPPLSKGQFEEPEESADLAALLPEGFTARTGEKGLVWPSAVPQMAVLAHPSVGGFVTHCGWNSCLESIWHGVPMLAWPLYAEQHFNAFEMVRVTGVALGLAVDREKGNFVTAEELERGVRRLMEKGRDGDGVRRRVEEVRSAGRAALKVGGSSVAALQALLSELL